MNIPPDLRTVWPLRVEHVELRSRVLRSMRSFFAENGFDEVETPVRIPCPANERYIDAQPCGAWYLRTSPELHMKRLLAAGCSRIYQVGACFRQGERGSRHNPEFTMLEWYRSEADCDAIMEDTVALVRRVVRDVSGIGPIQYGAHSVQIDEPWRRLTVRDVFRESAGWDPIEAYDSERFDRDLVQKVEPRLPTDRPVILADYPAEAAALARLRSTDNGAVAERWELYIAGLELANAFSELTDAVEQRRRFTECASERAANGRPAYPIDEAFMEALAFLPRCAGVALGLDRLVMLLAGAPSISHVRFVED